MTKHFCIFCKSSKFRKLFVVSNKQIIQCTKCSLIQTYEFEEPDYSKYHRDSSYKENEYLLKFFFEKRFSLLKPYLKNKKTVLEIGCSTGIFLDIFKKNGFDTCGIEPSTSARYARKKGHVVYQTPFEKTNLPLGKFDVVILNHVLEHVLDPKNFLLKIHKILAPNGILFIDVPNAESFSCKLLQSKWPYFLPEEHVSHFTKETLCMILQRTHFDTLFTKTKSGVFEVSNPFTYLFQELLQLKKNFFLDILSIPENIVSEIFDSGNSISFIARKK